VPRRGVRGEDGRFLFSFSFSLASCISVQEFLGCIVEKVERTCGICHVLSQYSLSTSYSSPVRFAKRLSGHEILWLHYKARVKLSI
jgi:hypothetical protein